MSDLAQRLRVAPPGEYKNENTIIHSDLIYSAADRLDALEEFAAAVRGGVATQFGNMDAYRRYVAAYERVWPGEQWGGIKDGEGGTYVEGWMPNTPDRRQSEDK